MAQKSEVIPGFWSTMQTSAVDTTIILGPQRRYRVVPDGSASDVANSSLSDQDLTKAGILGTPTLPASEVFPRGILRPVAIHVIEKEYEGNTVFDASTNNLHAEAQDVPGSIRALGSTLESLAEHLHGLGDTISYRQGEVLRTLNAILSPQPAALQT